jgi:hypothetical protein
MAIIKRTIYAKWNPFYVVAVNNITNTTLIRMSKKLNTPIENDIISIVRDGQRIVYEKIK